MQILVTYGENENAKDAEAIRDKLKKVIKQDMPINAVSELAIREEDIIFYFYWEHSRKGK